MNGELLYDEWRTVAVWVVTVGDWMQNGLKMLENGGRMGENVENWLLNELKMLEDG